MNSLVALALIVFFGAVSCLSEPEDGYLFRNRYRGYKYRNRYGGYRYKATNKDSTESQCNPEVNCLPIESPQNGQISIGSTSVGDSATFTCNQNYTLCGVSNVTCGNDGQWDGKAPICMSQDLLDTNLTVAYGDSNYYFSTEQLTFAASQVFCENLGGNLISINSNAEWEFILCVSRLLKKGFPRWNGLVNNNGTWGWTSGESVSVTFWHPILEIDRDVHCGFHYDNAWGAVVHCNRFNFIRFICEIKQ